MHRSQRWFLPPTTLFLWVHCWKKCTYAQLSGRRFDLLLFLAFLCVQWWFASLKCTAKYWATVILCFNAASKFSYPCFKYSFGFSLWLWHIFSIILTWGSSKWDQNVVLKASLWHGETERKSWLICCGNKPCMIPVVIIFWLFVIIYFVRPYIPLFIGEVRGQRVERWQMTLSVQDGPVLLNEP